MLILKSFASERSVDSAPCGSYLSRRNDIHLHCASGFCTQILAYMLDSLVRVSRRVDENHFVSIANPATSTPHPVPTCRTDRTLFSHALGPAGAWGCKSGLSYLSQAQRMAPGLGNASTPTSPRLSPTGLTDADPPHATGPPGSRMTTQHKEWDASSKPEVSIARGNDWLPALPSQQFQVLFNSLFKVLFIFPSRYLFAIGLPSIFSFR